MEFPDARLLIFAKAPIPGQVKTRLIPALGAYYCAVLQRQLSKHILTLATHARLCPVEMWCDPDTHHPFFKYCRSRFGVSLRRQVGSDLGRRMYKALTITLRQAKSAVLIGTDCPGLTITDLYEALAALSTGTDVVISPAEDGGYVLIGMRRCSARLFSGIPWGRGQVLQKTRTRLQMLNWQGRELPSRWDVDRPQDLKRLKEEYPTILLPALWASISLE